MEEKSKQKAAPLFYIFKGIFQNRKFRCPFTQCCKYYSHKNKMLAHLRTHVPKKYFNIIVWNQAVLMRLLFKMF